MATVSVTKSVASGSEAKGSALATTMIAEIKAQCGVLKRFLVNIRDLDHAGRKAFRVTVSAYLKKMRATVTTMEDTPQHATYAATARSAGVRMSEAVTFSKACDVGYNPDMAEGSYHWHVSEARKFLAAEAAGQTDVDGNTVTPIGPTRRRGRQATPFIDKVKNLVTKESPSIESLKNAAEMLATMVQLMEKQAA